MAESLGSSCSREKPGKMLFFVQRKRLKIPEVPPENFPHIFLIQEDWNDFGYRTMCLVKIQVTGDHTPIELGSTRVMRRGQPIGPWVFDEGPTKFRSLDDLAGEFCSLSKDPEFYDTLIGLGQNVAHQVLGALKDAILTPRIWASFEEDLIFRTSLLREGSWIMEHRDRIRKKLQIDMRRRYRFEYTTQIPGTTDPTTIPFVFKPRGRIPSRINLIVGANGTGKTQFLARLATAMCGYTRDSEKSRDDVNAQTRGRKKIEQAGTLKSIPSFYRVVSISFNPFDQFEIPTPSKDARFEYTYCGIRDSRGQIISQDRLAEKLFILGESLDDNRRAVLEDTISEVLGIDDPSPYFGTFAEEKYSQLSAGQKIVLNILSHLISNLKESTLVLIDEPETHLHPTLITTLIEKLRHLLQMYNSFAIIASHSPIVAQQIPGQYVKVLSRREDGFVGVEQPYIETFGETLSELTDALFEAREYERNYTIVLDDLLGKYDGNPDSVSKLFDGLGSNALRYLYATARELEE